MSNILFQMSFLFQDESTFTTKIYTHPNFELAMQYVNQVTLYGKECNHSVTN